MRHHETLGLTSRTTSEQNDSERSNLCPIRLLELLVKYLGKLKLGDVLGTDELNLIVSRVIRDDERRPRGFDDASQARNGVAKIERNVDCSSFEDGEKGADPVGGRFLEDSDYCALRGSCIDECLRDGVDPISHLFVCEHGAVAVLESDFGRVGLDGLVDVMTDS